MSNREDTQTTILLAKSNRIDLAKYIRAYISYDDVIECILSQLDRNPDFKQEVVQYLEQLSERRAEKGGESR